MLKRIGAMIIVVILVALFIATFILGIMGSKYLMGMIFLDVVIPILLWAMALVARLFRNRGQEISEQMVKELQENSEVNEPAVED